MTAKTVAEYGEKAFLKEIVSKYSRAACADNFDDCIVLDLNKMLGNENLPHLVYSIDHPSFIKRSIEEEANHRFYGRWVAAVVCGDVLAMGAQPMGFSMDVAAPLHMDVQKLEWIMQGIQDVLGRYGATYEGGNFDVNVMELVGMAWGLVSPDHIIRRAGAQEGDLIAVTTTLGYGWADYVSKKLDRVDLLSEQTVSRFKVFKEMPVAPHKAILAAARTGGITSGMDLSDGLIEFLYTIREKNGLGACIFEEWITITCEMREVAEKIVNIRPGLLALEAGYDTPLGHAYTVSPGKWADVSGAFEKLGAKLYKVGLVRKEPEVLLATVQGKTRPIPPFWDDQFRKENRIQRWMDMVREF
jgi:thiamine monophosphate kinase